MNDDIKHLGFRVTGRRSQHHDVEADQYELLEAARDSARYLDERGWIDIAVHEVRFGDVGHRFDPPTDLLIAVEWRIHMIGAPK